MSHDFAHSQRAQDARTTKADKLATFLLSAAGPWPTEDHDKRVAEKAAGVRVCSDETWDLARAFYDDTRAHRQDPGVFVGQRPSVG